VLAVRLLTWVALLLPLEPLEKAHVAPGRGPSIGLLRVFILDAPVQGPLIGAGLIIRALLAAFETSLGTPSHLAAHVPRPGVLDGGTGHRCCVRYFVSVAVCGRLCPTSSRYLVIEDESVLVDYQSEPSMYGAQGAPHSFDHLHHQRKRT
jgi:hypothetical protein